MNYIQSNYKRTFPHHFDQSCVIFGIKDSALDYRLTSYEEIIKGKFDNLLKIRFFSGSVEFMQEIFHRAGLPKVTLPRNSNRKSRISTLGEARKLANNGELNFIKPIGIKQFTGMVLDKSEYTDLAGIPDSTPIRIYKIFDSEISSEWRIYIHNHKAIDARNYSGDFRISPDWRYLDNIIAENKSDFPCAYTIDIGILETRENVVIEFNDMWAIGNYGMNNRTYFRLLRERYFEIILNS